MKTILFTIGDPSGISVEVLLKFLAKDILHSNVQHILFGDRNIIYKTNEFLNIIPNGKLDEIFENKVKLVEISKLDFDKNMFSQFSEECTRTAYNSIINALDYIENQNADILITLPVNKLNINKLGFFFTGHTEFIANYLGIKEVYMSFLTPSFLVGLVTTHLPVSRVPLALNKDIIYKTIKINHNLMEKVFGKKSKMAVCGLNPHAGEGGIIGVEDKKIIEPAIEKFKKQKSNVEGPFPADTIFRYISTRYQSIIAMYHDQGLIPVKLLERKKSVNITLGLPLYRLSVDHGTAYDIAGTNSADSGSLEFVYQTALSII